MKKFVEEKKRQIKFKLAGPGHRLASDSVGSSSDEPCSASLNAALQRCEQQKSGYSKGSSHQQTKDKSIDSIPATTTSVQGKGETDASEINSRILFTSSELGEGAYPMDVWMEKAKAYIEDKKSTDRVEASIIALKTLNPENEAQFSIKILQKYISNLIKYPDEEKYKIIRLGNPNIQKLMGIKGAVDFLSAVGFENKNITFEDNYEQKEETYLVYIAQEDLDLNKVLDSLESVGGISFTLDRNVRVTLSGTGGSEEEPDEFYEWTVQDMKKERKFRKNESDKNQQLRTRKMREEGKMKPKSDYTFIRVRLPDGVILQVTFGTNETLADLRTFLTEKIQFAQKFFFVLLSSKPFDESDEKKTFLELDLFPTVTLMIKWYSDLNPNQPNLQLKQNI